MSADIAALQIANDVRWGNATFTRGAEFAPVAERLVAAKPRYQTVEAKTGVPWWAIAVIHEREAAQAWDCNIAQGDRWDRVSTHVPKGRGPFANWEAAAVDALVDCAPHAARWTDWSPGGAMTLLEQYNGLGYFHRGLPSPYIWSGTDQYVKGKYVRDGVFDADAVDRQLGCAGLVIAMQALDPSIRFGATPPSGAVRAPPKEKKRSPAVSTGVGVALVSGAAVAAVQARLSLWAMVPILAVVAVAGALIAHKMQKKG